MATPARVNLPSSQNHTIKYIFCHLLKYPSPRKACDPQGAGIRLPFVQNPRIFPDVCIVKRWLEWQGDKLHANKRAFTLRTTYPLRNQCRHHCWCIQCRKVVLPWLLLRSHAPYTPITTAQYQTTWPICLFRHYVFRGLPLMIMRELASCIGKLVDKFYGFSFISHNPLPRWPIIPISSINFYRFSALSLSVLI